MLLLYVYNINLKKYIFRGKRVIFVYFIILFFSKKLVDCGIVSIGQLLAIGHLTYNEFKTQIHTVNTIGCLRVH